MKLYIAFLCGSLLSALCSFGLVFTVYKSHVGKALSFLILGTGGGICLSAIGIAALLNAYGQKEDSKKATISSTLCAFFLPLVIVLGGTWLFSLNTGAGK